MIQYDRIAKVFTVASETPAPDDPEVCIKLNEALNEVRSWLDLKRRRGRYAHGFVVELAVSHADRRTHVHAIYDEIGKLEGSDNIPSMTKRPRQMQRRLRGLWHKHYFQPGFIPRNLLDETERMAKDGRWEAMFAPHYGKRIDEVMGQIAHEMVIDAYERRARDQRITGEFIIYERLADGSNYYITLGKHGDWDAIRARVDEYKKFDAGDDPP